jgi:hypothetical protein
MTSAARKSMIIVRTRSGKYLVSEMKLNFFLRGPNNRSIIPAPIKGGTMKIKLLLSLGVSAIVAFPAFAQVPAATPAVVQQGAAAPAPQAAPSVPAPAADQAVQLMLPDNTPIQLSVNEQLDSRTHEQGDMFSLTVVSDVMTAGHVVIPRGTRARGQITWRTGSGSFGKSGKMEIAFRFLELNGLRVPLRGMHRQEGSGNSAATVGAVLGAGVIGGLLVRGHSALIQANREFTAFTVDPIPFTVNSGASVLAASYTPTAIDSALGEHGRPNRNSHGHDNSGAGGSQHARGTN